MTLALHYIHFIQSNVLLRKQSRPVCRAGSWGIMGLAWGPDGGIILTTLGLQLTPFWSQLAEPRSASMDMSRPLKQLHIYSCMPCQNVCEPIINIINLSSPTPWRAKTESWNAYLFLYKLWNVTERRNDICIYVICALCFHGETGWCRMIGCRNCRQRVT